MAKAKQDLKVDVEIDHDPFYDKTPHKILKHPEGFRLYWCNPRFRSQHGYRGWTPVTYDEEIGQRLTEYLADVPSKLEAGARDDNVVQRGDVILCKLPIGIWRARQKNREEKSAYKSEAQRQERFGSMSQTVGDIRITKPRTDEEVSALEAERDEEKLTPGQRQIRGRKMFGE